jgi:hypothetical protein
VAKLSKLCARARLRVPEPVLNRPRVVVEESIKRRLRSSAPGWELFAWR